MRHILLLLFVLLHTASFAQREQNYIYLLDCTKSMIGYNGSPNIWEPTKSFLKGELGKHKNGTTLHVIPFQGKVLPAFNFTAENFNWKTIDDKINKYVENVTNTNICDAWDATDKYIDKHKNNYIILLTDGKDNVNGMPAVVKKLRDWCGKYPNSRAYYVQLTKEAIDASVTKVIDLCDEEFIVNASEGIRVFGSFDERVIYANTLNLDKTHQLHFLSAGKYTAKAIATDPYFDVELVNNKIEDGVATIKIAAKQKITQINSMLPEVYNFNFEVQSDEVSIINPMLKVEMTNKLERTLEMLSEEADMGKATWYDSFLFWGASKPDTLSINLKAAFNNEAKKDGSVVDLQIVDPDGGKDFQLYYNGRKVDNGKITLRSNENAPSILSIVFDHNAKEGKRYLSINHIDNQKLDKVNNQPVNQYQLTLRSKYVVNWNPLKTILMWLGILILAALLLWFLIVKRLIYPPISINTIQINDPYFSLIRVKGKRRIVFTNNDLQQGLLNKIFTGEILYKKNEIWTSPLAFEAGSKKKTLRVIRTKDYVFDPYSTALKAPNDYVVENVNNGKKIKMTIN